VIDRHYQLSCIWLNSQHHGLPHDLSLCVCACVNSEFHFIHHPYPTTTCVFLALVTVSDGVWLPFYAGCLVFTKDLNLALSQTKKWPQYKSVPPVQAKICQELFNFMPMLTVLCCTNLLYVVLTLKVSHMTDFVVTRGVDVESES